MTLADQVEGLRAQLADRDDSAARFLRLRLERSVTKCEMAELTERVASLPPLPTPRASPLKCLHAALKHKLRMTADEYEQLQLALVGEGNTHEAWKLLFSQIDSKPLPVVSVPPVKAVTKTAKSRTLLLLELLTKISQQRQRGGISPVSSKELLNVMETKSEAPIKKLLKRLAE